MNENLKAIRSVDATMTSNPRNEPVILSRKNEALPIVKIDPAIQVFLRAAGRRISTSPS